MSSAARLANISAGHADVVINGCYAGVVRRVTVAGYSSTWGVGPGHQIVQRARWEALIVGVQWPIGDFATRTAAAKAVCASAARAARLS